tara:strand:- start:4075 stop:4458 length:384 start_codon:yes stop_codon:yes gene_type:complete
MANDVAYCSTCEQAIWDESEVCHCTRCTAVICYDCSYGGPEWDDGDAWLCADCGEAVEGGESLDRPQGSEFVFSYGCEDIGEHWIISVNGVKAETQPNERACQKWIEEFRKSPEMQEQFRLDCDRGY